MYSDNSLSTDRNDGSPSPSAGQSTKPSASGRKSSTEDRVHRCSYCGNDFKRSESKNMPFCSRRCQQIDLGMWGKTPRPTTIQKRKHGRVRSLSMPQLLIDKRAWPGDFGTGTRSSRQHESHPNHKPLTTKSRSASATGDDSTVTKAAVS